MGSRGFTRVNYSSEASIKFGDALFACKTDNLSLRGMYLKTDQPIPLHATVQVSIYHAKQLSLEISAEVVRQEKDGIGLQISCLNADSFAQLRDIVADNCSDYGKVMKETFSMLECIK